MDNLFCVVKQHRLPMIWIVIKYALCVIAGIAVMVGSWQAIQKRYHLRKEDKELDDYYRAVRERKKARKDQQRRWDKQNKATDKLFE